jgi:hypothetical protein
MPNIILTDEELQEVDRLLAEYDPERHADTALPLGILGADMREVLCTWTRESQRTALDIALPMRAAMEAALSVSGPRSIEFDMNIDDGWASILRTAYETHPLFERAGHILRLMEQDTYLAFGDLITAPARKFSRVDDLYESAAETTT